MNIERGFPNPKHGNGDSWNSVTRGMPIPHESGIRCTHDSWTTTMAEGSGDTTATPKGPIPLNNETISTHELGSTINPEEPTPIGNGIVHKANDCKPVTPGNSFPHGIGRSKNSWTPVTPEKLINEKSDTNPVGVQENQSESDNWRDLIGMYTGLLKEVTPDQNKGVTSVPYFKTNDPANWKCNHLASIVCSKSSNEAQNTGIRLSNRPRGPQVERNTSMRSTSSTSMLGNRQTQRFNLNFSNGHTSKDGASSSTITDSFQFAPITPAKPNNNLHVQEILNFTTQETNKESPPSAISTTQKQQIVPEDKDEQNIDFSKTPNQKTPTRRRKHRPRVIKPQKPKKDPKPDTTTTTPSETRVKRKYVRKKGVNISETKGPSVVKRKYVRKKGIDKFEGQQKNPVDNISVKSCKKKLNFDLDQVEQDGSHDISNRKQDINLNVNPQDIQQERRMMPLPVINVPIAKTTPHVRIVPSFILDEKRGNKRQSSDMNSLLLYQKLLLGVARRAHDGNIFMENHKKRKIMQSQFQDNSTRQMNGVYNGSVMQILHPYSQKVNPTNQPPMSYMIRSVPERLHEPAPVPTKEGIKYGVITYPASVYNQSIKKDEISVEYVTYKLEHLHINGDKRKGVKENELVVYRGSDAIVPFEPIIKKRNQRPKVDLDPDTERVWRLLMGKEGSEGGGTVDEDKEKWWENERRVFRGRADSFIARMHLVQGDRRFSRWKGSVVDSVIGVFLTQNVSDHLSSSAFMLLAAKFPLKPSCEGPTQVEEKKDIMKIQDSIESSVVQTVDEIRSSSGSNSEAEDLTTGHVENCAKKENTNSKEENASHEPGANTSSKEKKRMAEDERNRAMDWDSLRKEAVSNGEKKEQNNDARDSLDYEALRHAPINEISDVIKERGMNNLLADRMKEFLNRVVRDHGKIDLEWLRDAPPDKAKEYLLSFRGLGLKSVECVRLLTLHHLAFPVDTNVGRIAVRLGWVPLQPLPESLQLHLLEMYPVLDSIQKYLWPRLCKLDQLTLYELHYQMITFGKVFCTKSKPNCNACPMRAECRHFASAFASARLSLPGPEEKRIVTSDAPVAKDPTPPVVITPMPLPQSENDLNKSEKKCEPIIEEPTTPEPEPTELSLSDIEDQYYEDSDEIPSIKLNMEEFTTNLQNIIQDNKQLQDDMSKALVALKPNAAYIPTPKLKDVSRLRTEHQVYELPDSHRLLEGLEKREPDDPSPYLLAIWTPGETANSIQPPERECLAQESGKLCDKTTCFSCNNIKEANSQVVRGTILIPCRTAMRGSFPLNGTYFQVNEMFADHASSLNPIDVPRSWIWNLPRRTVYFGTSVSTIFRGLSTHGIQYCFWKGFVCVRGFDRETRAPRPLMARLHFSPSKLIKIKNEGK